MTQLVLRSGDVPLDLKAPVYRYALRPYISENYGHGELWICRTGLFQKGTGKPFYRAILLWSETKNCSGKVVFDDSSLAGWGIPDEMASAALSFFCVSVRDVDAEYFEKYTRVQRNWRDLHAESTGLLAFAHADDTGDSLSHLLIKD